MDVNVDLGDGDENVSVDAGEEDDLTRKAPKVAKGIRYEIQTGYGDLLVNIVEDEHGPVEVIANVGKSGGTTQSMTEAIGRLVSLSLQNGVDVDDITHQLRNIRSPKKVWDDGDGVESVPDGVALALERYQESDMNHKTVVPTNIDEVEEEEEVETTNNIDECPECHSMSVVFKEGCKTCKPELGGCGWSKCG